MRTGAIFARGSCRALKWLALFGLVAAVGVGQASAQIVVTPTSTTVAEGDSVTVTLSGKAVIPSGTSSTTVTVTVTPTLVPAVAFASRAADGSSPTYENEDVSLVTGTEALLTYELVTEAATTAAMTVDLTPDEFTVTAPQGDADAEDETFEISFAVTATGATAPANPDNLKMTVDDDEEQSITLMPKDATAMPTEGGDDVVLELKAKTPVVDEAIAVSLRHEADDDVVTSLLPMSHTFLASAAGDGGIVKCCGSAP